MCDRTHYPPDRGSAGAGRACTARKLTAEQRKEKVVKKVEEDRAADTVVAVFRVDDLSHPQRQYKVSVNAGQMALTGTAVITHDISVVIVEGGTRGSTGQTKPRMVGP